MSLSATVLEAFDTQMLDYQNDTDFSMHISSSDTWLNEEASMEDDRRILPLENPNAPIEVDMEPYEDENQNPEYEMEDGSSNLNNEIVDVEVYDVTRAHSPETTLGRQSPVLLVSDDTHPPVSDLLEDLNPAGPRFIDPDIRSPAALTSGVQYLPASSPETQPAPAFTDTIQSGNVNDTPTQPDPPAVESTVVESAEPLSDPIVRTSEEDPSVGRANSEELDTVTGLNHVQRVVDIPGAPEATASEYTTVEFIADSHEPLDQEKPFSSSASSGDPHEISEGVYIDPPPAVLLSLSTDLPSISLFNTPSELSSSKPSEAEAPATVVLLGHLPTLYYEPLASVFAALRQDEYIRDSPELLNGELILDAYDLELVMSEDYTFAHEFSLHDLNVLHDGLNNFGPLRLRLKTVTPRFLDRYQLLQERIAQMHIPSSEPVSNTQTSGSDGVQLQSRPEHELHPEEQGEDNLHEERGELASEDTEDLIDDRNKPTETASLKSENYIPEHLAAEETEVGVADTLLEVSSRSKEELDHLNASDMPKCGEEVSYQEGITVPDISASAGVSASLAPETGDDEDDGAQAVDRHRYHEHEDNDAQEALQDDDEQELSGGATPSTPLAIGHEHKTDVGDGARSPRSITTSGSATSNTAVEHYVTEDSGHLDESHPAGEPEETDTLTPQNGHVDENVVINVEEETELIDEGIAPDLGVSETGDASYELEAWDDTLDGEGDLDVNWEDEEFEHETASNQSNQSSTTLSSKTSMKRNLSEAELEDYEDDEPEPTSTDSKRPRVD